MAERLGRKWIAADLGKFAIHTTRKRMLGVQRELKAKQKDFRAFEVLNLGRYERQAYLSVGGRLSVKQKEQALAAKEREFRDLILKAYKATGFGRFFSQVAVDLMSAVCVLMARSNVRHCSSGSASVMEGVGLPAMNTSGTRQPVLASSLRTGSAAQS